MANHYGPPPLPPPIPFQQYTPHHVHPQAYANGAGASSSSAYQHTNMHTLLTNQDGYDQGVGLVEDEEYNRLLKNYKLAHERIEEQRLQMLEQEKQNAQLRKHIDLLEGGEAGSASIVGSHLTGGGGSTVDDFTIKNSSSGLERRINRWAADTLTSHARLSSAVSPASKPHIALVPLAQAVFADIPSALRSPFLRELSEEQFDYAGLGLVVQSLLRHAMSEMLSVGIVNKLLVTNSDEANQQLTLLHEQLFDQQPLVASVWRRQTFSAAVSTLSLQMSINLLQSFIPNVLQLVNPKTANHDLTDSLGEVIELSCTFSRMLHASKSPVNTGGGDAGVESSGFYRAFVPEIGSQLDPTRLELIKRCHRTERGEPERVGACLFPGLFKVSALDTAPANLPLPPVALHLGVGIPARGALSPIPSVGSGASHTAANGPIGSDGWGASIRSHQHRKTKILVVRRAQVICECALAAAAPSSQATK